MSCYDLRNCHFLRLPSHAMENHNETVTIRVPVNQRLQQLTVVLINYDLDKATGALWNTAFACWRRHQITSVLTMLKSENLRGKTPLWVINGHRIPKTNYGRNSINRWYVYDCVESVSPIETERPRLLNALLSYFHSIGVHLSTGIAVAASVCSDKHTRAHTRARTRGTMTVCLIGWELGVMISPESAEPWAVATLTATEPQVGQHGTTALGMHSCPQNPPLGSAANPVDVWLRCVWSKIRPFTASAPKNLWICGILLLHHSPLASYQV